MNSLGFYQRVITIFCVICTTVLGAVYYMQLVLGFKPCILCVYQRLPYLAGVFIGLSALSFLRRASFLRIAVLICGLLMMVNTGLAAYHISIERHWIEHPATCETHKVDVTNIDTLRESLSDKPAEDCAKPMRIAGLLSLPEANALLSLGLMIWLLRQSRKLKVPSNEKR